MLHDRLSSVYLPSEHSQKNGLQSPLAKRPPLGSSSGQVTPAQIGLIGWVGSVGGVGTVVFCSPWQPQDKVDLY